MENINKGKKLLFFTMRLCLSVSIAIVMITFFIRYRYGFTERAISGAFAGAIRVFLTWLIFSFIHKGSDNARDIATLLLSIGVIFGVYSLFTEGINIIMLFLIVVYIFTIIVLRCKSVMAYMEYKRIGNAIEDDVE